MAKKIEGNLTKEIIVRYKGYVIRSVPNSRAFIALPKLTLAFYHEQGEKESREDAVENMRQLIDSEVKE